MWITIKVKRWKHGSEAGGGCLFKGREEVQAYEGIQGNSETRSCFAAKKS